MSSADRSPIVGIDLGTTFSVVAHLDEHGRAVTIANAEGDLTTPSVVFLDRSGLVVGKEAVKSAEFEPDRVAPYPKRDMGSEFYHLPVRGAQYRPEVLQSMILRKLKADAEAKLGPLSKCVITVPAYFNEPRRKATQDAGKMAGWDVIDIINEPTAAAVAYGVHRGFLTPESTSPPETILVYDLGGGTFDVTLMRVEQNCFTTLATSGDVELGGIDWDDRIADLVAERFIAENGIDPRTDPSAKLRLRREAEDAKRSLSTKHDTVILFAHEGKKLRTTVTRQEFEDRSGDLTDRTIMTVRKLLREAKTDYAGITRLLVVGGSSRMPMIRTALEQETGFTIDQPLSVDEAVAHGAAIYARYLQQKESGGAAFRVRNVNSHTLGVLGIEPSTMMRRRKIMIARNTPLPVEHTQRFLTAAAGQKSVVVTVIEGGDDAGNHSTLIGRCVLDGLAPNLPPRSQVDVTFIYSDDGRLAVRAFMPAVNRESLLTIERAKGMSGDLIDAWAQTLATGLPDGTPLPEGDGTSAAAQPITAQPTAPAANPLNSPDARRMPKQVDETNEPAEASAAAPAVALPPASAAPPKPAPAAVPPKPMTEPAAKVPTAPPAPAASKPAAASAPATPPAPPTKASVPAASAAKKEVAPPVILAAELPKSEKVVESLTDADIAGFITPDANEAPPVDEVTIVAAEPEPEPLEIDQPFGDVIPNATADLEGFSLDPNKKRKKKKKPAPGAAPAAPTAESPATPEGEPTEQPKKKPAWKFW